MNWLTKLFAPKWNTDLSKAPLGEPFLGRVPSAERHKVQVVEVYGVDTDIGVTAIYVRNQNGTKVIIDAWMPLPKP